MKIGVYDPKTDSYRRVVQDGKLSEPVAPPWGGESRKGSKPVPATPASDLASVSDQEETPAAPPSPWMPYAVGGAVTGFLFMLTLLRR